MKFAVSYMNFFDNELKMCIVEAESRSDALICGATKIINSSWLDEIKSNTEEVIKQYFFDTDQLIEAIQI